MVAPEIVLTEMVRTARLPRRIAERARLILNLQPILSGERRGKRRGSLASYARQSIFPEALAVFELTVAATGEGAEALARAQAVFAGQDLSQIEPEPDARAEGPQRAPDGSKRRRRRGGRRGGGGKKS